MMIKTRVWFLLGIKDCMTNGRILKDIGSISKPATLKSLKLSTGVQGRSSGNFQ